MTAKTAKCTDCHKPFEEAFLPSRGEYRYCPVCGREPAEIAATAARTTRLKPPVDRYHPKPIMATRTPNLKVFPISHFRS